METITKEEWQDFVAKNSDNSYSLVVCMAILELIEQGAKTKEDCQKVLTTIELGLSGAQAEFAIGWHLNHKVEGLPDKEMEDVSTILKTKS